MAAPYTPQKLIMRGAGSAALTFLLKFAARASMLFIAAKLYGVKVFGAFALAVAVIELLVPLANLGLKRMIFPWLEDEASSRRPAHIFLDALLLSGVTGLAAAGALMTFAALSPVGLISEQLRLGLLVLAPAVLGQITADLSLAVARWKHSMRYEVVGRGLVEPYVATGVTLAAWYAGMSTTGLLLGYWAGTIALAVVTLLGARHCLKGLALASWRPDARALKARFRALLPASWSDVVSGLSQRVDLYLVGIALGDAAAGIYSVVRELRVPILHVRTAFDSMVIPSVARTMRAEGDVAAGHAVAATTRLILCVQLAIVLALAAAGEALLGLFGPRFIAGYPALIVAALAQAVSSAFGVSELILYFRKPGLVLVNNLLLIGIAAVLVPLLAVPFGLTGAASAMLVAAIAGAVARRQWLRGFGIRRSLFHAAPPVIAALAAAAAGWLLRDELLEDWPAVPMLAAIAAPLLALALYGAAVWLWLSLRPGSLSLNRFSQVT